MIYSKNDSWKLYIGGIIGFIIGLCLVITSTAPAPSRHPSSNVAGWSCLGACHALLIDYAGLDARAAHSWLSQCKFFAAVGGGHPGTAWFFSATQTTIPLWSRTILWLMGGLDFSMPSTRGWVPWAAFFWAITFQPGRQDSWRHIQCSSSIQRTTFSRDARSPTSPQFLLCCGFCSWASAAGCVWFDQNVPKEFRSVDNVS